VQLSDHQQRADAGDESAQGPVSRLWHCLCRQASLRAMLSGRMAAQDWGSRRAPSGHSWMDCRRCAEKYGGIRCRRAGNIA